MARAKILFAIAAALLCSCAGGGGGGYWAPPSSSSGACLDGVQGGDETGVDCGGSCKPCGPGGGCNVPADCSTGACSPGGVCLDTACADGVQSGGETGIDCGGGCPACTGEPCSSHAECVTGFCASGTCEAASCTDGQKNGVETGVDCGAGDCPLCPLGQGCRTDANCISGWCGNGHCGEPGCADGIKNGGESDVDCGGPCGGCADSSGCKKNADCRSGRCDAGLCATVEPACDDGIANGGETGTDCGGPCAGCGFGEPCNVPSDCISEVCVQGQCAAPATCGDGTKNGAETDVDCGGSACNACAVGLQCLEHGDCLSLTCLYGRCEKPTCDDRVQNQQEVDVDCGGPCAPCEDGKTCRAPGDCASGACERGKCCSPNACGVCTTTPEEICDGVDNDCDSRVDEEEDIGESACPKQAGVCAGAMAVCAGEAGWVCEAEQYFWAHEGYEPSETTCDGLDNDCDGATDEELRNACGECGGAPVELCNGEDDDCDGAIDEEPGCAACAGAGEAVFLDSNRYYVGGTGFQVSYSNAVATLGSTAWMALAETRSNGYSPDYLYELVDGVSAEGKQISGDVVGAPTLDSDGESLHMAVAVDHGLAVYRTFGPDGTRLTGLDVTDSVDAYVNIPAVVASRGGHTAVLLSAHGGGARIYVLNEEGAFGDGGKMFGEKDLFSFQLVMTSDGTFWGSWREEGFPFNTGPLYVRRGRTGTPTMIHEEAGPGVLRVGPDDSLHLVYGAGSRVYYMVNDGSGWSEPEQVGTGSAPRLTLRPDGSPVVVHLTGSTKIDLRAREESGWSSRSLYTFSGNQARIREVSPAADDLGRVHVGFVDSTVEDSIETKTARYLMVCPGALEH